MLAAAVRLHLSLGLGTGVLIANPIPAADEMSLQLYERALHTVLSEADARYMQGRALTPFLLDRMRALTAGAFRKTSRERGSMSIERVRVRVSDVRRRQLTPVANRCS